jgi:hypothetical protein
MKRYEPALLQMAPEQKISSQKKILNRQIKFQKKTLKREKKRLVVLSGLLFVWEEGVLLGSSAYCTFPL